jgi:serine/threonine-protein kinase
MPDVNAHTPLPAGTAPGPESIDRPGLSLVGRLNGAGSLGRLELIALLRADQLQRWQRGQRVPVEAYLEDVPALRDDPELAIDLVFSEFVLRRDVLREAPCLDEYLRRFPQHATALQHQHELEALWKESPGRTQGNPCPAPTMTGSPPAAETAPAGSPGLPGYQVLGELGRGGMGLVLRGHDPHLDRDLAIKLLHEEYRGQPHLVRRFLNEARVCGRLQHPGVVPVYELGSLPDRRPFFTMKLVEGRTLAELLAGREESSRLLPIFEQVCQTLAYAHSKGVIHRDLKPSNVMVGTFGEVQVMDWGLAKVLARKEEPGSSPSSLIPHPSSLLMTQSGGALGTLPYMPPEQARGEVERMDERSDVFGLGAILCEVLTGSPPFTGRDRAELLERVKACDHAESLARLDASGAGAELVRLAKRCLAAEPSERPRDAGVVAEGMTAHLAGVQQRLRGAEVRQAAALARAEEAQATAAAERRSRRWAMGLAAAVLLMALGGGVGLWWLQHQQQAANDAANGLLAEAQLLLEQATQQPLVEAAKYDTALETARKASRLATDGGASASVRQRAADLVGRLEAETRAAARDRQLLRALGEVHGPRAGPKYRADDTGFLVALAEPSADDQFRAAFRLWDATFDVDVLTTAEAAARLKGRPPVVVTEVIAALDAWTEDRRRAGQSAQACRHVADLAAALDDSVDSRRRDLRDLLARGDLGREAALGALAMALRPVPVPCPVWPGEEHQRLRQLAEQTDPAREPVSGLLLLEQALRAAGDTPRAERLLEAAVRARPQEVALRLALGLLLEGQQRWQEAVTCYEAARALRPELGTALVHALVREGRAHAALALADHLMTEQPDNPWLHPVRGSALQALGRYQDAEAEYREAIRHQPGWPEMRANLGNALVGQNRHKDAEAEYREAIALRPEYAKAHYLLGNALVSQARLKEAEAEYRESLRHEPDYPEARKNLGACLADQGRYKESEPECREAVRLRPDYASAHYNLGNALFGLHRVKEAEAAYREAVRLRPDYASAHYNLGNTLYEQNQFRDAEAAYREAIRAQPDHVAAHNNLGDALTQQQHFKEAEAEYREAVRIQPDDAELHSSLGECLHVQGRYKEAEAAQREAVRLNPKYAEAWCQLGQALREQGRFGDALDALRRGDEQGRQKRGWAVPSAEWIRQCERLLELDRRLPDVLKGAEPSSATERLEFAALCQMPCKRLHVTAARLSADAFAAEPALAADLRKLARYNAARSAVLAAAGQAEDSRPLPDKAQLMLRRQALGWLRADLAAWQKQPNREEVRRVMRRWQEDANLAGVREGQRLGQLPEAERREWLRLWDEVASLAGSAETPSRE